MRPASSYVRPGAPTEALRQRLQRQSRKPEPCTIPAHVQRLRSRMSESTIRELGDMREVFEPTHDVSTGKWSGQHLI